MKKMENKKYLTLWGKIGYGMGDSAWCFISCIISSFMLIYLTDTVGMNAGIVGSLMMAARIFDGISDVIFGRLLDKTHTKMGKARPWMFWSIFGASISLVALFSIPASWGDTAKYVYFFIFYMLANTVFYTSGYIAYSTLMSLITKNSEERVQITAYRTIAGNLSYMILGSISVGAVAALGGGAAGWRNLALVYAVIAIVINTVAVFSSKELPEEGDAPEEKSGAVQKGESLGSVVKAVLKCRYFYFLLAIMALLYAFATIFQTSAVYYATYVLGDTGLLSVLVTVNYGVTMAASFLVPLAIKKMDVYKTSIGGMFIGLAGRVLTLAGGMMSTMGIILLGIAVATIGTAVIQTLSYTMMASTSEYVYLKDRVHANGIIFSCSSMGIKVGSGIGSALCGILLELGGYVANAEQQSQSCINMLNFLFLWFPIIVTGISIVILFFMDVDKQVENLRKEA